MKRVVNGVVVAAFAVGLVAGSLSLVPTWAQTVPITVVSGTVTANLSATDNAVLDDIADGITVSATNLDVQSGGVDLATAAAQATQSGYLDGLETLLGTIDAALSVLDDTAGEVANEYVTVRLTDGSSFLSVASDGTIGSSIGTSGPLGTAVYADFDGVAIPTIANVDTEGELVPVAASIKGVQYMMLVSEDGSLQYGTATTPLVVGDGAGALNVIVDSATLGTVTVSDGSGAMTVDGTVTANLAAGTNNIGDVDILSIAAGDNNIGNVDIVTMPTVTVTDGAGAMNVIVDSGAMTVSGTNIDVQIGGSDTVQVQSNSANLATQTTAAAIQTAVEIIDDAQTGDSIHYRTSAGSTEDEHEVKATAGRLFSVAFTNTNAAVRYWRCSNLTAANTTPGTSAVLLGLAIPGATTGGGFTHTFGPNGAAFSTALTCWFVTGAADTDVAEVAANEIKAIYTYK